MLKQMSHPDNASTTRSFFHKSAAISRVIPVVGPAAEYFTGGRVASMASPRPKLMG
jgi:hypothetical protein